MIPDADKISILTFHTAASPFQRIYVSLNTALSTQLVSCQVPETGLPITSQTQITFTEFGGHPCGKRATWNTKTDGTPSGSPRINFSCFSCRNHSTLDDIKRPSKLMSG